ncbi:MAG TPA: Wzz/FepE/Etk N-terminal domain-containing protein [Candidatus Acidoferrales bacterium]|nr:Wzz/FepE/Etk N-terminal domain-containing protein [Candidatus Acidoferrales bacterium]
MNDERDGNQARMDALTVGQNGNRAPLRLTLRDVAMPVFRHRRLASLIFLGILLGAVLSILVFPRKYEAEMKIFVNRDRVDAVVTPDRNPEGIVAPAAAVSEEDINSEVELLKSRDLLEQVVLACGLESSKQSLWARASERLGDEVRGTRPTREARLAQSVQTLEDRLIVDPLKKTTLIRVGYTSSDPHLSARVLQTLATLYQEKHAEVHRPQGTFSFFDQQTARYRNELATAEAELADFDGREGVVAPAAQKQLVLEQLSQFEAALQQDQLSAYAAGERSRALHAEAAAAPQRETTQIKRRDNGELLAQLEGTLLTLELKRSDMLVKYAPAYPPVEELSTQIELTQKAIAQARQAPVEETTTDRVPAQDWMATELAKSESDRAQLEAQASAAARVVRRYQDMAQQLDRKGALQDDLVRNEKTAEDNYLLYLRKREEARISDALDSKRIVNVSIAEAATVPALPTLRVGWLLIAAFFIAGIAGGGTAYAVDRMDPSFRTPDELGKYLDVRVLASIPASGTRE